MNLRRALYITAGAVALPLLALYYANAVRVIIKFWPDWVMVASAIMTLGLFACVGAIWSGQWYDARHGKP